MQKELQTIGLELMTETQQRKTLEMELRIELGINKGESAGTEEALRSQVEEVRLILILVLILISGRRGAPLVSSPREGDGAMGPG